MGSGEEEHIWASSYRSNVGPTRERGGGGRRGGGDARERRGLEKEESGEKGGNWVLPRCLGRRRGRMATATKGRDLATHGNRKGNEFNWQK